MRASFGFQTFKNGFGSLSITRSHQGLLWVSFGCWVSFFSCPWHRTQTRSSTLSICAETQIQSCPHSQLQLGSFCTRTSFGKNADSQNAFPVQPQTRRNEKKGMIRVRSKLRCVQCKGMGLLLSVGIQIMLNLLALS